MNSVKVSLTSLVTTIVLVSTAVCQTKTQQAVTREVIDIPRAPLAGRIAHRDVGFLARDLETGADYVLEGSDLQTRHTPWSMFKIPHLLIALESGVASSLESERLWDPERRPAADYWPDAWRRDQTLRTAFQRSVAWYFQDIALEIDAGEYRETLSHWGYGNAVALDGSDRFWLDNTLKISVDEKVVFLNALLRGGLDVSARSIEALVQASFVEAHDGVALHGKTGSGPAKAGDFDGAFEGWYAGMVRRSEAAPVVFALHVRARDYGSLKSFRKDFATELLIEVGVLPVGFSKTSDAHDR